MERTSSTISRNDYDGLPSGGREFDRLAYERRTSHLVNVDHIASMLESVAQGCDVAICTSFALYDIQEKALDASASRLSEDERERLIRHMKRAAPTVISLVKTFNPAAETRFVTSCTVAASTLIALWAEDDDPRKIHGKEMCRDINERVRWLRSVCHSISLQTSITKRAHSRRERVISNIKTKVGVDR
ncbi:conserved hypothetical protein [Rhizobium leguminosarum bv. trifolii WSM2304]|uniref:Uncharacterized protein n=1 Tax=Rhizobium leguminosarum bv. trifolii (strain WSM2304) TaxID=395492 RepID=A0ABF7QTL6_RHILW|nr:hypothetical protein [Rhizobium leguminosarum]ACI57421.1 conserved hypothetical protein [Rhizobium leguminosarum bv. trifolii WSM2304]